MFIIEYIHPMAKAKQYSYIIDGLTSEKGEKIKKVLQNIDEIKSITINVQNATIDLISGKDVENELKYACEMSKTSFRVKINNKKGLFS